MFESLRVTADAEIAKKTDELAVELQERDRRITGDFARRNVLQSGGFLTAQLNSYIEYVSSCCRGIVDVWTNLIQRYGGGLTDAAVKFVFDRVEETIDARRQDAQRRPNWGANGNEASWVRTQVDTRLSGIASEVRRDLAIALGHSQLSQEVARQSSTSDEAFVILAAADEVKDAYEHAIMKAIEDNKLRSFLMAEREPRSTISNEILERIAAARLIVADLTLERPNCYYELGYAHALGKHVIICARDDHDPRNSNRPPTAKKVHFDVDHYRVSFWNPSELSDFRERLTRRVREALDLLATPRDH